MAATKKKLVYVRSNENSRSYWQTYLNNRMLCPPAEDALYDYLKKEE